MICPFKYQCLVHILDTSDAYNSRQRENCGTFFSCKSVKSTTKRYTTFSKLVNLLFYLKKKSGITLCQPAKLRKDQCGGVYFWLYSIAFWIGQQKLTPPELLFSVFACQFTRQKLVNFCFVVIALFFSLLLGCSYKRWLIN